MDTFFLWYETQKSSLHPIVLIAELHERLMTIHPFNDRNGKTSRLVINFILLQHRYKIDSIKGDYDTRIQYYKALVTAQTKNN